MRLIDADKLKQVVNEDIDRCYTLGIGSVGPLSHFLDQIDAQPTQIFPPDGFLPDGTPVYIKLPRKNSKPMLQLKLYCELCGISFEDLKGETNNEG